MRVMRIDPAAAKPHVGGAELLDGAKGIKTGWLWVDLEGLDPTEEGALLRERFGIHPLALQDAQRERHPPKLEVFGDVAFVLLKALTAETHDIRYETLQIAAFVSDRFLVTRRATRSISIVRAWTEALDGELDTSLGPAHVLYRVMRLVTDRYTGIVVSLETRLDELEDEMFANPDDKLLAELTEYSGRLKKLRRVLTYQQEAMKGLANASSPSCFVATRHEFNDLYENNERLASLCALYQELAVDLVQGYISLSAHRLNKIIKVLTIVTVLFLPLGLIAGLYGMNVSDLPGGAGHYGFFAILVGMAMLATVLLLVFRRLKWI
jgi:magnesium transporter